jgi:hypothetical protein
MTAAFKSFRELRAFVGLLYQSKRGGRMRRNIPRMAVMMVAVCLVTTQAGAATVASPALPVTATVPQAFEFTASVYKNLPQGFGPDYANLRTSMQFGALEKMTFTAPGNLVYKEIRSSDATGIAAFAVVLVANTQRVPYTITQTGTALTSGVNTIPNGSSVVTPVYTIQDNAGATLPAGASIGSPGSWVSTNKTLYSSGPSGASRAIQAIYSITGDPTAGATATVPVDQPAGAYASGITFTMTTV